MPDLKKTTESKFISNYLGKTKYSAGLQVQRESMQQVQARDQHFVIGLEHPAVITLGYRARAEAEIHASNNLKIEKISRGGFATIHSEGQLVIYPVINLRRLGVGVRDYIFILLRTTERVLKDYGIESSVNDQPLGLFTTKGKIAFCGVQVKHGITQHGISININNDLSLFQVIRSCGQQNASLDRVGDHASGVELPVFFANWSFEFQNSF